MLAVKQLQQAGFKTQHQKLQVLKKLELLKEQASAILDKQHSDSLIYQEVLSDVTKDNNEMQDQISHSGLRLKESMLYLEASFLKLNQELTSAIDENSRINLITHEGATNKQELENTIKLEKEARERQLQMK